MSDVHPEPVWYADDTPSIAGSAWLGGLRTEVCVIGAGIAGLSCAYHLAHAGKQVAIIERAEIAAGQTACTTAHLATAVDDRYLWIERLHGEKGAQLVAASHRAAIDAIAEIVAEERIDCDFRYVDGYLLPGDDPRLLEQELAAARRAGIYDVEWESRWPILSRAIGPCLRFPRQAQFDPLRYLHGLWRAIERSSSTRLIQGQVTEVHGGPSARVVTTNGLEILADAVIVATNSPINDRFAMHTKQAPYATYAVGIEIAAGAVPVALYWDTLDPYHYVRLQYGKSASDGGFDVLIVGGEDHRAGQASDVERRFERLETWARERFPGLSRVVHRWSGQVMEPVDGVAFIGRNPGDHDNIYIVTGDSGMGMTHGAMAGLLLTDLICGRPNPWAKLYDPSRRSIRSAWTFAQENLSTIWQYADWLKGSEVRSTDDIQNGQGAIVRSGMQLIAAYRDDEGELHACSAACPHLGGVVAWNSAASTWDCPCHGSRFDPQGKVIQGPAHTDLEAVTPAAVKR